MVSRAIVRFLRTSPRKARKVADLIRGKNVMAAESILNTVERRPTTYLRRLLKSAVDSATKKEKLQPANLYISLITVDGGPSLKRFRAASMGRATSIKHRTSHITLELDIIKRPAKKIEKEPVKETAKPVKVKEEKVKKIVKKKKET